MRSTYTFADLEVSAGTYDEIGTLLRAADYSHAFVENGAIDMHGIGLTRGPAAPVDLRAALSHIVKVCRASRSQTRRIRWIEHRAQCALDGKRYRDDEIDLPKSGGPDTAERLKKKADGLQREVKRLRDLLDRRPAMNAGLVDSYATWTGEVYASDKAVADRRAAAIEASNAAHSAANEEAPQP